MAPADGQDDGVVNDQVVFIDTSLDTHLAMIVSDSDTVSDFKRRVTLEHRQLFPAVGDIKVECFKVKQRGTFYFLSDSMLVKSAFGAAKRSCFVSVDASRLELNDRHDNHGSSSVHSKNVEEDRLSSDKQLENELQQKLDIVNTDMNSKKRTRHVHNESSLKDTSWSGPSVKKKRKTQRGKGDLKALEENLHDNDKVNDKGASINNENTFEHKAQGNDLRDEDKVDTSIEGAGSETVGDVAMVVGLGNNIQQEMSQKDKESELIQKAAMEDELHSSLMSTPDYEHCAAGVPAADYMKHSTKHKAAEKEVSSASFIKKLHITNKDATESSPQQDVASNGQECAGDKTDKYKDESEILLKQKPQLRLRARKKGAMGSEGKRRKTKKLFKHADNLVGDISSTTVIDERKMDQVPDKTLIDCNKGEDVIMKEMESSVENMERKEFRDTNDVVSVINEDNLLPHSESLMNNDADIPATGKHTSQVNAQGILDNLEKQNDKTDDTTKKKKKRKTKKSAGRNEGGSITKHVDGDICENDHGKDGDKLKEKDAQISYEGLEADKNQSQKLVSKNENNKVSVDMFKDPNTLNIGKIKTPKRTKMIDAQQSNLVQTRVKTVEKKRVNSSQQVKSLLNTPGTIFGSDSDSDSDDYATVNSDSRKSASSSSSSSSSSGETSVSPYLIMYHARKGKEGTGNSQSKLKNTYLLRSSSSSKKAKATASSQVEDTESQPVDFVPDSQL